MLIMMAAALAAAVSWLGNNLLTKLWRKQGIIFVTPILEEGTKTLAALGLNQSIILVHGMFGVIEAIYDLAVARKNGAGAALIGVISHLFYGIITFIGKMNWSLFVGVLLAYAAHTLWNAYIMKLPEMKDSN